MIISKSFTLLFPGQGSQYVGMGKTISKEILDIVDNTLGFKLSEIMTDGSEDLLKQTQYTQPAILTLSYDLWLKCQKHSLKINRVLGHSVGEYAALVAAGVLNFEDALKSVHLRGKFMQEATPIGVGKMVAILKLDESWIEKACKASSNETEQVMPANFNDPKQIVISGHAKACDRAVEWLQQNCTERFAAIPLPVSAPFHSSLMKLATEKMKGVLHGISFKSSEVEYIANVDAKIYPVGTSGEIIKENLIKQVEGSVRWTQSLQQLSPETPFLEVGPGKVLTGLCRRILSDSHCTPLDQFDDWSKL